MEIQNWKAAREAFRDALELIPGNHRAAARLALCERRLEPALPGFEIVGAEFDPPTGQLTMFSKIIRRTHMYLALFLTPWVLMYALSTMAMNHRAYFQKVYGAGPPAFEKEREQTYTGTFPPDAKPQAMAEQILSDLGMDGRFGVAGPARDGRITINRQHPIAPRRIIYTPADQKLVIEKQVFRTPAFLERMHRRRGFQTGYPLENAWAFSVDLVIVAMVFWVASGLWMWWEMRGTRRWGALSAAVGIGLFGFFLLTI